MELTRCHVGFKSILFSFKLLPIYIVLSLFLFHINGSMSECRGGSFVPAAKTEYRKKEKYRVQFGGRAIVRVDGPCMALMAVAHAMTDGARQGSDRRDVTYRRRGPQSVSGPCRRARPRGMGIQVGADESGCDRRVVWLLCHTFLRFFLPSRWSSFMHWPRSLLFFGCV